MTEVFEIRLRNTSPIDAVTQLVVRVEGLPRNDAILLAEEIAKSHGSYEVLFVITGPKPDLNK